MSTDFSHCIQRLSDGIDLNIDQAYQTCVSLFNEEIAHKDIVLLLQLLANKGESTNEILGFIKAMRERMTAVSFKQSQLIDICGTGGSLLNRFNVSTCVAMVLGSLGYHVAKHGNRGSKKPNGSFDFLDEMKIPYDISVDDHQYRLNHYGATFLFARNHHKAVGAVAAARKELSGRSIFNLIGPFCNPASPSIQIIGTPNKSLANRLIAVGKQLNYDTFSVITSDAGLDEVASVGLSTVIFERNGTLVEQVIDPTEYGIRHTHDQMFSTSAAIAADNASLFKQIIKNKLDTHPITELICLNAAVIINIIDNTLSIQDSYKRCINVFSEGRLSDYLRV